MNRWDLSHGHVGVNAPSWLTFEIHRPYFDGGISELTAIQARGSHVAARLFAHGDWLTPRFGMVMPLSFRHLLTEESRLTRYRLQTPDELPEHLASDDWQMMAQAYRARAELPDTERAALALWLVAATLPKAMLELAPTDFSPDACADPVVATVQVGRAMALFQRHTLGEETEAAFSTVLKAAKPSVAQLQAASFWAYLLARHSPDNATTAAHLAHAQSIFRDLTPELPAFDRAIWHSRLVLRQVTPAERLGDLDRAWRLLQEAKELAAAAEPATDEQAQIATELRRRTLDRTIEIAVKRADEENERELVQKGLELDPWCVKIHMQSAQMAHRHGDLTGALHGYLLAARLGPYGTGHALLSAAHCAEELGDGDLARVLHERAFRAAPRSEQTRSQLIRACRRGGDEPLAEMMSRPASGHGNNWHYRMYGAYFNLGVSQSPCLYSNIPRTAFEFAASGQKPRVDLQRVMPPAFRTNLIRQSGLDGFDLRHPAELPEALRTPQWERLCEWVRDFAGLGTTQQYLVSLVLFRLGLRPLITDLIPARPATELREAADFYLYWWRAYAEYADAVGGRSPISQAEMFAIADNPHCPLHLRFVTSTFAVVYAGRATKSIAEALRWRERAQEYLHAILSSDEFTPFEKVMLHSRFYRGVGFTPFLQGDRDGTIEDMAKAEELARAVPAQTPYEHFLKQENLHACLESRSKEAFGLGDIALGHSRTEEFLALDPYDPKSHIEMAESLSKQERYADAAASYLRAARLGPMGTAVAYHMAGVSYSRAGLPALAEDCFLQAIRLDPHAISAALGWRDVSDLDLARQYAGDLETWGAARGA